MGYNPPRTGDRETLRRGSWLLISPSPLQSLGYMKKSKNGGTPRAGWFVSWKIPSIEMDDWSRATSPLMESPHMQEVSHEHCWTPIFGMDNTFMTFMTCVPWAGTFGICHGKNHMGDTKNTCKISSHIYIYIYISMKLATGLARFFSSMFTISTFGCSMT